MSKRLLSEEFNFKGGYYITKDNNRKKVVIIDPELSQSTVKFKDKISKTFGAKWISTLKTWGWWVDTNTNEVIKNKVTPCIKFLLSIETTNRPQMRDYQSVLKEIMRGIREFQAIVPSQTEAPKAAANIKQKLNDFTERIKEGLDNPETNAFLSDLIRYRNELKKRDTGYSYGYLNTLSILLTKPDATLVRPTKQWEKMGYQPKADATPIVLIGYSSRDSFKLSKAEKAKLIADYLAKRGVESVEELEPSAKYDLENRVLNRARSGGGDGYHYGFVVYDEKDVEKAREDAETMPEEGDNWWYSKIPADTKDGILTRAVIKFGESIEGGALKYNIVDSLGGARGNATIDGTVNIVKDEKSGCLFPTVVHELTHQLRHWEAAYNNNPSLKKFYRRNEDRAIREYEAELSAAFVTDYFGYPIQHELNYLSNWGLKKDQVQRVFEDIAKVSDYILNGIINNIETEEIPNA